MNTKTVEIGQARRHDRPPLLRALEYLLYAVLFVVLVVPPAFVYGLIIKDAANFREYEEVQNFYENPQFSYKAYSGNYDNIPEGTQFEYTTYGRFIHTDTYTMLENPVYVFGDGTRVALWKLEDEDNTYENISVYVLENGDFLLSIYECARVDDLRMGEYCPLSNEVEKKILDVVRSRLPYDVEQSLEWVYAKVKGRQPMRNAALCDAAGSRAYITFATDNYAFVEAESFAADESGETFFLPNAYLIFERATGEQVSIDRFCVGGSFEEIKPELTRRMFATRDPNFDKEYGITFTEEGIAEAAAALKPEYISFAEDGLRAEIPPGSISAYTEVGFDISARYEAIADLITFEP